MKANYLDIMWIIIAAALVFLMQAGFATLESGLTRSKNSINVAIKNITDFLIATILFWLFGYALMFGKSTNGLFGETGFLFQTLTDPYTSAFFLFQVMFCATAATIVSGAVAERIRFDGYIFITIVISGLIYPIFGHWAWGGGWLSKLGFVDFAGSTVVHSIGGWISLAAVIVIGPRKGRFGADGSSNKIPGHDLPLAILGTLLLFFGWFGFNGGSTLKMDSRVPSIILNTMLAGCAGALSALAIGWYMKKIADVGLVINGSLAGLVAITANCHAVNGVESILIGIVAGGLMLVAEYLLDKFRLDDVVGAFPVHGVGGIWGTLAVGIFGNPKSLDTGLAMGGQILIQLLGIVVAGAWAFGFGFLFFKIFNKWKPLRVTDENEYIGLNIAEHGATTEILDLFKVLDEQAKTGDLSLRAPVEPFTEVGQIADRYNRVLSRLEISEKERDIIFHNVHDGLFLLDRSLEIGSQFSSALGQMFEDEELAGMKLTELLKSSLPAEKVNNLQDFLELMFEDNVDEESLRNLNPLKTIGVNYKGIKKHIQFRFIRVMKHNEVVQVLVNVRDITSQVELENKLRKSEENTKNEMERVFQIITIDPEDLKSFISSMSEEVANIHEYLSNPKYHTDYLQLLHSIFRAIHSIKGESSLLGLKSAAEKSHEYEERISEILKKEVIEGEDFVPVVFMLTQLDDEIHEIKETVGRLKQFQRKFGDFDRNDSSSIFPALQKMVAELAQKYNKEVEIIHTGYTKSLLPEKHMKAFKDILIQLIRNSIVHGIEHPEDRMVKGKSRTGNILIKFAREADSVTVTYRDDGAGLKLDKIREKAIGLGFWSKEESEKKSVSEIAQVIFSPQFSTNHQVDIDAGRGMGMDIVKNKIVKLGGKIRMAFNPDKYFELQMKFSLNSALQN